MSANPDAVDASMAAIGAKLREAGFGGLDVCTVPLAEVRERQRAMGLYLTRGSQPIEGERTLALPGLQGAISCRYYPYQGSEAVVVYFHGGGFAYGDVSGWDACLRQLSAESRASGLSVDYPLAPEAKFPRAFDEVVHFLTTVRGGLAAHNLPCSAIIASGDSAGANLALAAAIKLRREQFPILRGLALIYGVFSGNFDSPSWQTLDQYGLSRSQMRWIWRNYLSESMFAGPWRADPRIAPLRGNLRGLPPVHMIIGNLDPLLDDNVALRDALAAEGIAATLDVLPGLPHGFIRHFEFIPAAQDALRGLGRFIQKTLNWRLEKGTVMASTLPIRDFSREEMSGRIARFKDLKGFNRGLADDDLPGTERTLLNVLGFQPPKGESENVTSPVGSQAARSAAIKISEGFNVGYVRCKPGNGPMMHNHDTNETFIPITGKWRCSWNEKETLYADLDPLDCISFPAGAARRFENITPGNPDDEHLLMVIVGGNTPAAEMTEAVAEQIAEFKRAQA